MLKNSILSTWLAVLLSTSIWVADLEEARAQELTLRMAHAGQTAEPLHILGTKWAELLKERTKGDVVMKVYPQGQLGGEKSLAEQLRLGTIDATMIAAFRPLLCAVPFAPTSSRLPTPARQIRATEVICHHPVRSAPGDSPMVRLDGLRNIFKYLL